jgi:hypothetical protein
VPAGELALDRVLPACSQSIAAYASSVVASPMPRSAPSVTSPHQARVESFEPGAATLDTMSARARSRWRPAGPSSAGRPSFEAIAWTAATCPCGSDRAMLTAASPAGTRASPFSAASTASTMRSGIFDRFASVSFRIFPPSR